MFQQTTNYHHHPGHVTFPARPTPTPTTQRFQWVAWHGQVPTNAVYCGDSYLVVRAYHSNEWIPGKLNLADGATYVAYNEKEVHVQGNIEVLTNAPGTEVVWIPASNGQIQQDAVGPLGKDGTFVGRVVCPRPENRYTPGKIHPSHKCLYLPWDGKECRYDNYEVCVIRPQAQTQAYVQPSYSGSSAYQWMVWQGTVPQNAVRVGDDYVVIRAYHANKWVPGKLRLADRKAYIPYNEKEVQVQGNIEVLTLAPGAVVFWVSASNGQVPQGAIGPFGDDQTYIGRAVCPHPESKPTPGKIHPAHKCLYLPWGGKEIRCDNYEVCVIQFGQSSYPSQGQFQQTGFSQPQFNGSNFSQGMMFGGHFGQGHR